MPKAKEKEYKVEFIKDVNGCWSGSAYVIDARTNKIHCLSCSVAPGTKATSARPEIRNRLKEMVAEYIAEHINCSRITIEEAHR